MASECEFVAPCRVTAPGRRSWEFGDGGISQQTRRPVGPMGASGEQNTASVDDDCTDGSPSAATGDHASRFEFKKGQTEIKGGSESVREDVEQR